jgi:hypothetical protein
MKTTILTLALIFGSLLAFDFARADNDPAQFTMKEEAYIDDIPFNTEEIAKQALLKNSLKEFKLKEEAYIDDIPFNTFQICKGIINAEGIQDCSYPSYTCGKINDNKTKF